MAGTGTPVVFIHGLWLHAESWGAWVDLFREKGYDPSAPGWPGDSETAIETRQHQSLVSGHGIDDIVDHYAGIIGALETKPIVIGHSFGGLIVQRLLGQGLAAAGVAIDPAPIKGVLFLPPSALKVASVALKNPSKLKGAVVLTPKQFRYGFGNALSEAESRELYDRWTIPSPGKPLFEAAVANFAPGSPAKVDTGRTTRGPLLLTSGLSDHTVPPTVVKQTLKRYAKSSAVTELEEFPGKGHSLTIDNGWKDVADAVLAWLAEKSL
ncbi:MAG TPA: alpha/beta hydrolase [Gaiellaceae bacterium]|jgi:pimeloyl-ACP methyl ester carboxylesterase